MKHPMRQRPGFVLLEVLVSLLILGVSLAAIMRSFTRSLAAVQVMEVQTQAQFFAMQLMHEFEINPPIEGNSTGNFGDDFKNYSWEITVRYVQPKYGRLAGVKDVERFFPMREVSLTIRYNDGTHKPLTPLSMETAIVGFEKMSSETKRSYGFF